LSVSDRKVPEPIGGSEKSPSGTIDVNSLLASSEVTIRPQEDPSDADLRRFKDRVRFLISWAVVLVVGGVALHLTLSDHTAPDRAAWGRTILAGLVSALGGYAIGKTEKR
jgi:hypothetical protein